MTVKELSEKLKTFDPNHSVIMEIIFDCATRKIETRIDDVKWENGNCVLHGVDY